MTDERPCPAACNEGNSDGLVQVADCKSSFKPQSYLSARLFDCNSCGRTWLEGYHEDFDDVPIEAEWGNRVWIWRQMSEDHVEQIRAYTGTALLDLDSFGL